MSLLARKRSNASKRAIPIVAGALFLAISLLPFTSRPSVAAAISPATPSSPLLSNRSLSFEQNDGQTDPAVHFMAHAAAGTFFFTQAGITVALNSPSSDAGFTPD